MFVNATRAMIKVDLIPVGFSDESDRKLAHMRVCMKFYARHDSLQPLLL